MGSREFTVAIAKYVRESHTCLLASFPGPHHAYLTPLQSSTQAPAGGTSPTAIPTPLQWSLGSLLLYQRDTRKVQTATGKCSAGKLQEGLREEGREGGGWDEGREGGMCIMFLCTMIRTPLQPGVDHHSGHLDSWPVHPLNPAPSNLSLGQSTNSKLGRLALFVADTMSWFGCKTCNSTGPVFSLLPLVTPPLPRGYHHRRGQPLFPSQSS